MSTLRRFGYAATGSLTGVVGGFFTFTALHVLYEKIVHGKDKEELKIYDGDTEREIALLKTLDIVSAGGAITGGLVGYKWGNVQSFSFLRLLKVSAGGCFAGAGSSVVAVAIASHIVNSVNEPGPK